MFQAAFRQLGGVLVTQLSDQFLVLHFLFLQLGSQSGKFLIRF